MSEVLKLKKSNCKNCYKCIRHCPVKSIRFSGNQAHIVGNECILCGQCFVVCPQNAKEIIEEVENVKVMLMEDEPVIASIAPSFIANYNGIGIKSLEAGLKKLGFTAAEETAIGATIVKKEYEDMLREKRKDIVISSCCHSVNLLIQKYYPEEMEYLADVVSPMQAHCIDIKRRYPGAKTVFIGPCVAKKDEANHYSGIVDGVLIFEELTNWLKEENIILEKEPDDLEESKARLFPIAGGILKTMNCDQSDYTYMAVDGVADCIAALQDIQRGELSRCFIEMSACEGSCIGGPVMEKYHHSPVRDYMQVTSYAGEEDFSVKELSSEVIHKQFEYISKKLATPDDIEIGNILCQMGKKNPEQELNCGSCGYDTCREKAIAIYQGKANISMCLPFLKEKAESFSDTIIKNTTTAIVVLNEELEVQQINSSAMRLLNIRGEQDVLGEPVIRILDPSVYIEVRDTGKSIRDQRIYLAEYRKYVEQTILYDREYHIIICLMRDVTDEECEREKKESIRNQTVKIADKVVEKQMRVVQEIASLLGETTAETKIALSKLKESITDE